MKFIILVSSLYIAYKLYSVFIEVRNASLRNKIIFIDEFKKNGYMTHSYTVDNYNQIKSWVESSYPQIEHIKNQDLFYASIIFKSSKSSQEYKQAIKYKEDISKIYKHIEFDTLRECFKEIIKIEKLVDENFNISNDVFEKNQKLFKSMHNDLFFRRKISQCTIALSTSIVFSTISSMFVLLPIIKSKIFV